MYIVYNKAKEKMSIINKVDNNFENIFLKKSLRPMTYVFQIKKITKFV